MNAPLNTTVLSTDDTLSMARAIFHIMAKLRPNTELLFYRDDEARPALEASRADGLYVVIHLGTPAAEVMQIIDETFAADMLRPVGSADADNRARVALLAPQLADLATDVDAMRKDFKPHPVWFDAMTQAVELLHGVAMDCDTVLGLGIYAADDEEDGEVRP